jgi:hypothetical protein
MQQNEERCLELCRQAAVEMHPATPPRAKGMANRRLVVNPAMASAQQTSRLTRTRGASLMELSADL